MREAGRASEALTPAVVALTVLAFAAGSSSITSVTHVGSKARWVMLVVLLGVGVVGAVARGRAVPFPRSARWFLSFAAAFALLAMASSTWALGSRIAFERAGSFWILLATVLAVTYAVAGDVPRIRRLFAGVVVGAVLVALLGLLLLAVDWHVAVQQATPEAPWRFRGFGLNPNTAPMLYAVALAPTVWLIYTAHSASARAAWGGALLVFYASLILSESRGAEVASFAALVIASLLILPRWTLRLAACGVVAVAFAGGIALREIKQPPPESSTPIAAPPPLSSRLGGGGSCTGAHCAPAATIRAKLKREFPRFRGELPVQPQDEIGNPYFGEQATTTGSGRVAAWKGALHDVKQSPLLGYGFGNESNVFVDRWYYFAGERPENSYLGILLELGAVGLVLFGCVVLAAAAPAWRAARDPFWRGATGALLGVVVAAVLLMLIQSYIYSVGNIASLSVWLGITGLAAIPVGRSAPVNRPKLRAIVATAVVACVGVVVLVAAGRWERTRYFTRQANQISAIYSSVGTFAAPTLTAFRVGAPNCFWYEAGERPYALSLCFDAGGQLVEASDRRSGNPVYWDVLPYASRAPVRVDPRRIDDLIRFLDRAVRLPRAPGS